MDTINILVVDDEPSVLSVTLSRNGNDLKNETK